MKNTPIHNHPVPQRLAHPILLVVRGIYGSGKSYLAERVQQQLQQLYGQDSVVMLDPDATDYQSQDYKNHVTQQTIDGVDPALHPYRYLRAQAYAGIADHKVVMWNQPFTNLEIFNKMIANLLICADEHSTSLPILVIEVTADPTLAKARVIQRIKQGGHGPTDGTIDRRVAEYFSFAPHGYATISVSGEDDVAESLQTVLPKITELIELID